MTQPVPQSHCDILDKKALAHLATLMPDGAPQVTPVWCDFDGTHVCINSAKGRRKDRNMRRDPRVSLSLCDPDNTSRYLAIREAVVANSEDGADAHIDQLAHKYLGVDEYPHRQAGEVRVIYSVAPLRFTKMG